ncbi:hypothetical protein GY45DRAFT_1349849 [Cubamyces sp. BRFM 1775]|nr:hypothetical protein GY45DRAFT_1349849 [Cubamyces sp. BRFM 1775]
MTAAEEVAKASLSSTVPDEDDPVLESGFKASAPLMSAWTSLVGPTLPHLSRPLLDRCGRVFAVLAGSPRDSEGWSQVVQEAGDALKRAQAKFKFDRKKAVHRRGRYASITCGISYGGGQQHPGNLAHTPHNRIVVDELLKNDAIRRLAGFGDACMRLYAPRLYEYYAGTMDIVCRDNPKLKRNFERGVFGAATFNLGPKVVTYVHTDHQNIPSGWCAVTALGDFDYKKGGHLLLWDVKLAIEFPPGALILLPSAILRHSNATIAPRERRSSFTQFSAGGLFRWVECGCRSQKVFSAEGNTLAMTGAERWLRGVGMWSTWGQLKSALGRK